LINACGLKEGEFLDLDRIGREHGMNRNPLLCRWGIEYRLKGAYAPTENSLRRAAEIMEGFEIHAVIDG
jgi:hypothetical protein